MNTSAQRTPGQFHGFFLLQAAPTNSTYQMMQRVILQSAFSDQFKSGDSRGCVNHGFEWSNDDALCIHPGQNGNHGLRHGIGFFRLLPFLLFALYPTHGLIVGVPGHLRCRYHPKRPCNTKTLHNIKLVFTCLTLSLCQ